MIAEIILTGDEVRTGIRQDANANVIATELEARRVFVSRHTCVGDDMETLVSLFGRIGERADVAVVTGGLGPTEDDLTTEAAARAAGVDVALDETAKATLEAYLARRGFPMSASNLKQAYLPEGCVRLDNPVGTAPGFSLMIGKCRFFCLPGVPFEMRKMLADHVLPMVEAMGGQDGFLLEKRSLNCFGLGESTLNEKLKEVRTLFPEVHYGTRAKFPEVYVYLTARGSGPEAQGLVTRLEAAHKWCAEQLGRHAYATDGRSMEVVVGDLLRAKGATLALAESCTGGLIAHMVTNAPGSSDYFLLGAVTYANEAKQRVLGVPEETILQHGAVSEETAAAMAEGVRKTANADYGLSVSGVAGPSGGTDEKPVGTVCIGVSGPGFTKAKRYSLPDFGRERNKAFFAMNALNRLRETLEGS